MNSDSTQAQNFVGLQLEFVPRKSITFNWKQFNFLPNRFSTRLMCEFVKKKNKKILFIPVAKKSGQINCKWKQQQKNKIC